MGQSLQKFGGRKGRRICDPLNSRAESAEISFYAVFIRDLDKNLKTYDADWLVTHELPCLDSH